MVPIISLLPFFFYSFPFFFLCITHSFTHSRRVLLPVEVTLLGSGQPQLITVSLFLFFFDFLFISLFFPFFLAISIAQISILLILLQSKSTKEIAELMGQTRVKEIDLVWPHTTNVNSSYPS